VQFFEWLFATDTLAPTPSTERVPVQWDEQPHNRRLKAVVPKIKAAAIRKMDEQSRDRYDNIDRHITRLRALRALIKARKQAKAKMAKKGNNGDTKCQEPA